LVQENAFNPRPVRRELRSILHLFEDQRNFDVDDVNVTVVRAWMAPLMANYCQVNL
jgi:hypothetical protein